MVGPYYSQKRLALTRLMCWKYLGNFEKFCGSTAAAYIEHLVLRLTDLQTHDVRTDIERVWCLQYVLLSAACHVAHICSGLILYSPRKSLKLHIYVYKDLSVGQAMSHHCYSKNGAMLQSTGCSSL